LRENHKGVKQMKYHICKVGKTSKVCKGCVTMSYDAVKNLARDNGQYEVRVRLTNTTTGQSDWFKHGVFNTLKEARQTVKGL